jgi:hypothetical protein
MQVVHQQISKVTERDIFMNTDSSVNFVAKAFTRMLTTRVIWEDTIEGRNTNVRPVERNSQRNNILYVTEKFMILKEIAFNVKHVGKVFFIKANS